MAYFTQDFNDFFAELTLNNEKSWFDTNRKRYQTSVKEPWEKFLLELIDQVRKLEPIDQLPAAKFGSRINRDIRFSNDKSPYNNHFWAAIVRSGKKDNRPGYYVRLGVEGMNIGGGYYYPDKEELISIRRAIKKDAVSLNKIINSTQFKKYWGGELFGDKNKILPAEFKEAAKEEPLIANKGWHYWKDYDVDVILSKDLIERIITAYKAGQPLNRYLTNALET